MFGKRFPFFCLIGLFLLSTANGLAASTPPPLSLEQETFFDAYAAIKLRYAHQDRLDGFEKWFDLIPDIKNAADLDANMRAMVSSLNDPFSSYETRSEIAEEKAKEELPSSKLLEKRIAYIRIPNFGNSFQAHKFIDEFILCQNEAKKQSGSVSALILDLRGNRGGSCEEAIVLASLFLKSGIICTRESRFYTSEETFVLSVIDKNSLAAPEWWKNETATIAQLRQIPIVVLVNGTSASASEIVAAALQDHKRAKLIGVKTYGKGFGQAVEELPNGACLVYTQHIWLSPNNHHLTPGHGLIPDIILDNDQLQLDSAVKELSQ